MDGTWEKLKKLLGFGPNCSNGGTKLLNGDCRCGKYFTGKLCQDIICMNGSVSIKNGTACACNDTRHFRGLHCERLLCENAGKDNKNGTCKCLEPWYTGRFCEEYANPWLIIFGVVGGLLLSMVLLCVLCRLKPGCRKQRPRRRNASVISLESGSHMVPNSNMVAANENLSIPPPYTSTIDSIAIPGPAGRENHFKLEAPPPTYSEVMSGLHKFPTEPPPVQTILLHETSGEPRISLDS